MWPSSLHGGFTGVDVFFVLSGFLITSIILHDIGKGSFSLTEFYLRRIQRIVPNIAITVLVTISLAVVLLMPASAREVGRHGIYTLLNLSNFFIWRNYGGYWGNAAESAPLLHTWSLAVEEQFYLLFPTSLVLLARFQRNRITRWLLFAALLSFGICVWATPRSPAAAFYMLPARVWELLLGSALASDSNRWFSMATLRTRLAEAVGWIGLALILAGLFFVTASGFPGTAALLPTVGTALLIASVAGGGTSIARFLSAPFMVWTGKLSYSLYLWHWPLITLGIFVAEMRGGPPLAGALAGAGASVGCAWAAYSWIEQPLRSRGPGRRRRLAIIAAGFSLAMLASGSVAKKLPDISTALYFDRVEFHGLLYNAGTLAEDLPNAIRYRDVQFSDDRHPDRSWRSGGIIHRFGKAVPEVVVLGSSHALMYSRVIDGICRELGLSAAFLGVDGAPLFFDAPRGRMSRAEKAEFDGARRRWLAAWLPQVVVVIDRWDIYDDRRFQGELESFLRELAPLARTVLFVAQVPVLAIGGDTVNVRELAIWHMAHDRAFAGFFPDAAESKRKSVVSAAMAAIGEFPNFRVLRPDLVFYRPDGSVLWSSGRTVYYADDDHLSDAGAELVRNVFRNAIADASAR